MNIETIQPYVNCPYIEELVAERGEGWIIRFADKIFQDQLEPKREPTLNDYADMIAKMWWQDYRRNILWVQ